jgi:hypothetical protein
MDQGMMDFQALSDQLEVDRRPAWVKLVLGPAVEGPPFVWFAQVVVGSEPENWELRRWAYPECTFLACESDARRLASLFGPGRREFLLERELVAFDFVDSPFNWYRHPSRQKYSDIELPWPSTTMTPNLANRDRQPPSGYLVGVHSFPTFGGACAAFFSDHWVQTGASNPTLGQVTVRIVDERARIERVLVGAASLNVWVDGEKAAGTRLELNSSIERNEMTIDRRGLVVFPLPNGLGQDGWVWLKDKDRWIDYRSLAGWGGSRSADVEIEATEDPVADISWLATQGESSWLEYKRQLPDDTKEDKRKVLKGLVAFANGEGGTMVFGVTGSDDAGRVVGLDGEPDVLMRRLNDLIRDYIKPSLATRIKGDTVDGKFVIRVEVDACQGVITALVVDPKKPEFYVRRNGSTYFANPEELASLAKPTAAFQTGDSLSPLNGRRFAEF